MITSGREELTVVTSCFRSDSVVAFKDPHVTSFIVSVGQVTFKCNLLLVTLSDSYSNLCAFQPSALSRRHDGDLRRLVGCLLNVSVSSSSVWTLERFDIAEAAEHLLQ